MTDGFDWLPDLGISINLKAKADLKEATDWMDVRVIFNMKSRFYSAATQLNVTAFKVPYWHFI